MDACAIDSHLFAGAADSALEMSPTEDEPGLWLGVAEGDEGFLGSLESGGALLNAGSWTISTLPGEEGLRWSGVKTELFDGWAGQTANGKQTDSSPLSTSTPKPKSATPASTALTGVVKPDPEDGWTESVVPVVGGASWPAPSASLSGSHGSFAKWPPSPLLDAQTPPPPAAGTRALQCAVDALPSLLERFRHALFVCVCVVGICDAPSTRASTERFERPCFVFFAPRRPTWAHVLNRWKF